MPSLSNVPVKGAFIDKAYSPVDHHFLNCVITLTNRFHVAVSLLSNRSQMTSPVIYFSIRRTATWKLFVYIIAKSLFYFKIFQHNSKVGLLPRLCRAFARKKGHLT